MANIKEIEQHFNNYDFTKAKTIRIDKASKVTGLKQMVNNHVSILKANSGNREYMPYYEKLFKLYLISRI